jgi:hypothetical protein
MADRVELRLEILSPEPDEDETLALRRELLDLDVDDVRQIGSGAVPEGAKGVEALVAGTLVVTLSQEAVKALVATAVDWLRRRRGGGGADGVRIQIGDDVLALRDPTSPEDRALIEAFLDRHGRAEAPG